MVCIQSWMFTEAVGQELWVLRAAWDMTSHCPAWNRLTLLLPIFNLVLPTVSLASVLWYGQIAPLCKMKWLWPHFFLQMLSSLSFLTPLESFSSEFSWASSPTSLQHPSTYLWQSLAPVTSTLLFFHVLTIVTEFLPCHWTSQQWLTICISLLKSSHILTFEYPVFS